MQSQRWCRFGWHEGIGPVWGGEGILRYRGEIRVVAADADHFAAMGPNIVGGHRR